MDWNERLARFAWSLFNEDWDAGPLPPRACWGGKIASELIEALSTEWNHRYGGIESHEAAEAERRHRQEHGGCGVTCTRECAAEWTTNAGAPGEEPSPLGATPVRDA